MMARAATRRAQPDAEAHLSIGALAAATGIPVETLRTWEARYGFPIPDRKPSGHRVYAAGLVPRLSRIAEALARGHRAGHTVPASESQLTQLLSVTPRRTSAAPSGHDPGTASVPALLEAVKTFDADRLTRMLLSESARRGVVDFVETCVAPLLDAVGDGWMRGQMTIAHEHFVSERVGDLLRTLRLPFEDRARGPLVVCTTLPGEAHGLGLLMAALVVADAGCRVLFLGTEVPVAQVASLTEDIGAAAVAVSVSEHQATPSMRSQLSRFRRALPQNIALVVGGAGAPRSLKDTVVLRECSQLQAWAFKLSA